MLNGTGWNTAIASAGIVSSGVAESLVKTPGHLTRTRHSHQVTAVALCILLWSQGAFHSESSAWSHWKRSQTTSGNLKTRRWRGGQCKGSKSSQTVDVSLEKHCPLSQILSSSPVVVFPCARVCVLVCVCVLFIVVLGGLGGWGVVAQWN